MQKSNIKQVAPDQSMLQYFEGKVEIKKLITDALTKDFETFLVTFSIDGARPNCITTERIQVLLLILRQGKSCSKRESDGPAKTSATVNMDERTIWSKGLCCVPAGKLALARGVNGSNFAALPDIKTGKTSWLEQ